MIAQDATNAPGVDPSALGRVDKLMWRIESAFAFISSLFIFTLMGIGVVQIVGRKLFNVPIFGYIDLVELSMATFAFLAVSYCERLGGHVRMELLIGKLRGRPLWLAEMVGSLVAFVLICVLIYYGWDHAMRAYEYGDSTIDAQYPVWPSKLVVPLSFSVLALRLLVNVWGYARLVADPQRDPVAVPVIADIAAVAQREASEAIVDEPGRGH